MNRIDKLFKDKRNNILSVFLTAGYPGAGSLPGIIRRLADNGTDMVEIGMPFSDPIADGPVIQNSNQIALKNGMNLRVLFDQIREIREEVTIPLLLMGYLNPVIQFGVSDFCRQCNDTGIDGVILPDLPPEIYTDEYEEIFKENDLYNILLISPQSDDDRIHQIDKISRGFIYMVSSSSVTGMKNNFSGVQLLYFKRIKEMGLMNPAMIGFGISGRDTFSMACKYANGGIIGSAFLKVLGMEGDMANNINKFVSGIKGL
jgi:tryptophan synthase alpha chain